MPGILLSLFLVAVVPGVVAHFVRRNRRSRAARPKASAPTTVRDLPTAIPVIGSAPVVATPVVAAVPDLAPAPSAPPETSWGGGDACG